MDAQPDTSSSAVNEPIAGPGLGEWRFKAMLGDKEIGQHTFQVASNGDRITVDSQADFKVKVLFITAFDYQHRAQEEYEAGCLQQLSSDTRTGSQEVAVRALRDHGVLRVERTDKSGDSQQDISDCTLGFAYWNPEILTQQALLNPQTGELMPVEIALAEEGLISGQPAQAYTLRAAETDLKIWYAKDGGRWLGLESTMENGRILRYALVEDEPTLQVSAR